MTVDRLLFLDTNVLLTATDRSRAHHAAAGSLLGSPDLAFATSGQVLREYLVVATRPSDVNGFGMTPRDACGNVDRFLRRMLVLEETDIVQQTLRRLVREHGLSGRRIHDANIAATMAAHGLDTIVTLDLGGFESFGVTEVSPTDLE